jgi:hypothetical protein
MRQEPALGHPDRSAPRLGLRFAGYRCQIKFWLMHLIWQSAAQSDDNYRSGIAKEKQVSAAVEVTVSNPS